MMMTQLVEARIGPRWIELAILPFFIQNQLHLIRSVIPSDLGGEAYEFPLDPTGKFCLISAYNLHYFS